MKYIYIKKSIYGKFIEFNEPLKAEEYNNLGETWQDYVNNKWVMLSEEQIEFHEANPTASIKEVWDMELTPAPVRTLEQAKYEKIQEIEDYDRSEAVNSFTIGNSTMWLNVEERQQIATQISANEAIGRTEMTKWFNGISYTFPLTSWKQMLVALEVYAGDALNVTEFHKHDVDSLTSIEEVDNYDYTIGYPEKLNF